MFAVKSGRRRLYLQTLIQISNKKVMIAHNTYLDGLLVESINCQ